MRSPLALAAMMTLVFAGSVGAQDASVRETRCWLGSVTFSAGATMNVGSGLAICRADIGWEVVEGSAVATGCLLEGELSSVGAMVGVSNNESVSLQCGSDGLWASIAIGPES